MEPDRDYKSLLILQTPDVDFPGAKRIEIPPYNLRGYDIPRIEVSNYIKKHKSEFDGKSAVYILISYETESDGRRKTYIGESSAIGPRFEQHVKNKDYWQNALIFTSDYFNESFIKTIEDGLTRLAKSDPSLDVDTKQTQSNGQKSPGERYICEQYLEIIGKYMLSHTGFWGKVRLYSKDEDEIDESKATVFYLDYKDFSEPQKMFVIGNKYRIKKGTKISKVTKPGLYTHPYGKKYDELEKEGVFSREKGIFLKQHDFTNPSLPATIIKGSPASGPADWKNENRIAFKDCI